MMKVSRSIWKEWGRVILIAFAAAMLAVCISPALASATYIPPDPTNLANTADRYWVNYTWTAGESGNGTDSYNISMNETWTNGTTATSMNVTVGPCGWANIAVWAWNASGTGTLSAGCVSDNVQAPAAATYIPLDPASLTNTTGDDWVNYTWSAVTSPENDNVTDSYNISMNETWTNGTTATSMNVTVGPCGWANIAVWAWNASGTGTLSAGCVSDNVQAPAAATYIPLDPASLTNTTGDDWVNYTWSAGESGNVTDSYNISMNETWTNGTTATSMNVTVGPCGWANIAVWAWNASGTGTLSAGCVSDNVQAPAAATYIPLDPASLTNTTGDDWVNYTWSAGESGNVTDSYNISMNETWTNGTTATSMNVTVGPCGWANIAVWAWNASGTGTLSAGCVSDNVQAPAAATYIPLDPASLTNTTGDDWVNYTWSAVTSPENDNVTDSYNISMNETWTNGTTATSMNVTVGPCGWANIAVWAWNASGTGTLSAGCVSDNVQAPAAATYIPLDPASLTNTTGDDWVNYTWTAGESGNVTDSYNISMNETWTNGTTATSMNVTVGPCGWANIAVWAWNASGTGTLSAGCVSDNVQAPAAATYIPLDPASLTNTTGDDWVNYTWSAGESGNVTDSYNISMNETWTNGTTATSMNVTVGPCGWANIAVWAWNASGTGTLSAGCVSDNVQAPAAATYIPLDPASLTNTTGDDWVNYTWSAVTSPENDNVTDSYNISMNETWTNGTTATSMNVTVGPCGWANIAVWAWNASGTGTLSAGCVSDNVQAPAAATYIPLDPASLTNTTGDDWVNYTWSAVTSPENDNVTDSYNISMNETWTNGTTATSMNVTVGPCGWANIAVWAWNASGTGTLSAGCVSDNVQAPAAATYIPLDPASLTNTTGDDWVNYTWSAGESGNVTDSYNISMNETWTNGTTATSMNVTVGPCGWANIAVWAWNASGTGTLSAGCVSDNVQAPAAATYIPLDPASLTNTTGDDWVNYTWSAGESGNVTDSYNISMNETWTNGTTATSMNVTVGPCGWANIAVWAWNASGTGTLSAGCVSDNVQAPAAATYIPLDPASLTNTTGDDWVNYTWSAVTSPENDNVTDSYNISMNETWTNGTTATSMNVTVGPCGWANIAVWAWNASGTGTLSAGCVSDNVQAPAAATYIPLDPASLTNTTGDDWVNYTWTAGESGNVTDSYNISMNETWTNGTTATSMNVTVGPCGWANIAVWAWNASGTGTLSAGCVSDNVQAPAAATYIPLDPASLTNTTGDDWVNYTWSAGESGNVTDSYNISMNETWTNGTTATSMNVTVGPCGWANIAVWAWNASGTGTLSAGCVSDNVQAPAAATYIPLDPASLTNTTGDDWVNYTWSAVTSPENDNVTDSYNISMNETWTNGTTATSMNVTVGPCGWANIAVWAWNASGTGTLSAGCVSDNVQAPAAATYIPLDPASLTNTTGDYWVNYTWTAGESGNVTDSYNVSVNGVWHNGTKNTSINEIVGSGEWVNITVWAWNASGTGTLSAGCVSDNAQAPRAERPPASIFGLVGSSGGGGTYPPGWFETPTPTVTATKAQAASTNATATPPGERVTPAPTKKPAAAKATAPAPEGTTAETAKKGAPGFTAVFVIAGMLAVAYAMMRWR